MIIKEVIEIIEDYFRQKRFEERVTNLENLVNALVKSRALDKEYTDADINGTRQSVANITPWTQTKKAYIDDTEVVFTDVPNGNLTVYCDVAYSVVRGATEVTVSFAPLEEVIDVTISIL